MITLQGNVVVRNGRSYPTVPFFFTATDEILTVKTKEGPNTEIILIGFTAAVIGTTGPNVLGKFRWKAGGAPRTGYMTNGLALATGLVYRRQHHRPIAMGENNDLRIEVVSSVTGHGVYAVVPIE